MSHARRPVPAKRIFASLSEPHYPVRESDGEAHVGVMYERRAYHLACAKETIATNLKRAREARQSGDEGMWLWFMTGAAAWRAHLCKQLKEEA
jgi:hypothetical protein